MYKLFYIITITHSHHSHPHSQACLVLGSLDVEGLVGDVAGGNLVVVVGRVGNQVLGGVKDGKGGEADDKLAGPAAGDGVVAAGDGPAAGARGGLAAAGVDDVGARGRVGQLVVDGEPPGAGRVLAVAGARQALDDPVGVAGHERRGRGGGGDGDGDGEERLGELHLVCCLLWVGLE